jgi:hypothetical protein
MNLRRREMNKKLIVFCLALAIAAMSVPTYASSCVIGTWENNSGDGWINWSNQTSIGPLPSTVGGTTYSQSTIGVTNGSYSLEVSPPAGWGQPFAIHLTGWAMENFLANTKFEIDVTYDSGSWPSNTTYAQVYELSIQTSSYGWNDVGGAGSPTGANGVVFTDMLNPDSPGNLPLVNPGTPGTDITGTWIWDYSAILPGGSYTGNHVSAADTWANFVFALNSNAAGEYYFDNARFVPEPATIALLSLGGLALLRRQR